MYEFAEEAGSMERSRYFVTFEKASHVWLCPGYPRVESWGPSTTEGAISQRLHSCLAEAWVEEASCITMSPALPCMRQLTEVGAMVLVDGDADARWERCVVPTLPCMRLHVAGSVPHGPFHGWLQHEAGVAPQPA